jgi:hypothetical protein
MNGDGENGRRGQQQKHQAAAKRAHGRDTEDESVYVSSGTGTFEKWA